MIDITITLFERVGLLLIIAFVLTRIPNFKSILYREDDNKMQIVHAIVFGVFGIASTHFGVIVENGALLHQGIVWQVSEGQLLVSLSLVAIVIAGLLAGPAVGFGAGIIAGIHLIFLGGIGWEANALVNPLTGLLAGLTGRFFSKSSVISPVQALFIGVFPPILQMQMLLVLYPKKEEVSSFIDLIGLPLVLSNSLGIALFTAMIRIVLKEQENEAALATRQALTIAEEALPFLKRESPVERAEGLVNLLYERLQVAAISVTSAKEVLAHKGLGDDHHLPGHGIITPLSREALKDKEIKIAYSRADIQCEYEKCPLEAAIIIPILEPNDTTSLIKFYFKKAQHIRPVEKVLAQGLGELISNQLKVVANENLKANIRDAELRNLQAQINPHFLFNTLHLIATLFRVDPLRARHITIQLANFMRFNLRIADESLIILKKELVHVKSYIEIIEARFQNRLKIELDDTYEMERVYIPPSTIQPLVENAIEHGLAKVLVNGTISINMKMDEDWLHISVIDNGQGFDEKVLGEIGQKKQESNDDSGIGLYNVNQRLISLLGDESKLQFENLSPGCRVYFKIPLKIDSVRRNSDEHSSNDRRG